MPLALVVVIVSALRPTAPSAGETTCVRGQPVSQRCGRRATALAQWELRDTLCEMAAPPRSVETGESASRRAQPPIRARALVASAWAPALVVWVYGFAHRVGYTPPAA